MAFILDASVAISWCFPGDVTEATPYSKAILKRLEAEDAIVPEIWAFEIANSIFVSFTRRQRITGEQIREFITLLKALPIRVESQSSHRNIDLESLARRRNIAAYDAAYIDLAARFSLPLATCDEVLRIAATAESVELIYPRLSHISFILICRGRSR